MGVGGAVAYHHINVLLHVNFSFGILVLKENSGKDSLIEVPGICFDSVDIHVNNSVENKYLILHLLPGQNPLLARC